MLTRLRAEFDIPLKKDETGVQRFLESAIYEVREKAGIGEPQDVQQAALETLQRDNDSMRDYIGRVQSSERHIVEMLVQENQAQRLSLQKLEEAFLNAIETTQRALDHSAERAQSLQESESKEMRINMATHWLFENALPPLLQQLTTARPAGKLLEFVQTLDNSQIDALEQVMPADQFEALKALRASPALAAQVEQTVQQIADPDRASSASP